jgi:hypothetical protein
MRPCRAAVEGMASAPNGDNGEMIAELPRFVRAAPRIFYGIGVLDFFKNLMPLYMLYTQDYFTGIDRSIDMRPQLLSIALSAVIYAASWAAYGILATILLSIHDALGARGNDHA